MSRNRILDAPLAARVGMLNFSDLLLQQRFSLGAPRQAASAHRCSHSRSRSRSRGADRSNSHVGDLTSAQSDRSRRSDSDRSRRIDPILPVIAIADTDPSGSLPVNATIDLSYDTLDYDYDENHDFFGGDDNDDGAGTLESQRSEQDWQLGSS